MDPKGMPPLPAYPSGPPPAYPPSYQGGAPPVGYQPIPVVQTIPSETTYIYVTPGNCPACNVGFLQDSFTALGLLLAIFCFPIGILCCLLFTEKRCSNCGMTFG